jgi:hypothetical protein
MSVKYYGDLASQPGEEKLLAVRILFCLIHFLLLAGNVVQAQTQATIATPPISVEDAFRSRKTRLFLVTRGAVIKLLSDDNKGDSLDLSPKVRQTVKMQNSGNGGMHHGIVSEEV